MSGNNTVISYSTQPSVLHTVRKMFLIESATIKASLNRRPDGPKPVAASSLQTKLARSPREICASSYQKHSTPGCRLES
jgi:hypothetical protein